VQQLQGSFTHQVTVTGGGGAQQTGSGSQQTGSGAQQAGSGSQQAGVASQQPPENRPRQPASAGAIVVNVRTAKAALLMISPRKAFIVFSSLESRTGGEPTSFLV
jgi:hypothetical protein